MAHKAETGEKVNLKEKVYIAYSNIKMAPNSPFSAAELCAELRKKGIEFEGYELAAVLTGLVCEEIFVLRLINDRFYLQAPSDLG